MLHYTPLIEGHVSGHLVDIWAKKVDILTPKVDIFWTFTFGYFHLLSDIRKGRIPCKINEFCHIFKP